MIGRRRVIWAAAGLVLVGLFSAYLWGEVRRERGGRLDLPPDEQELRKEAAEAEEAFAKSRFAQQEVLTYQTLKGERYFALQVKPRLDKADARTASRPRDLLLLVCTTASMGGAPLNAARQMAEALAAAAGPEDRIDIWTLNTPDDATRSLTKGFVPARGPDGKLSKAVQAAFQELARVVPLADTDLGHGLRRALADFDREGRQRVVVYFGDGFSLHRRLEAAERVQLTRQMVDKRIVFYSVPLGKHLFAENLHGLALGTGGVALRVRIFDEKVSDAVQRAQEAFAAPILYPTQFTLHGARKQYPLPEALPPLRGDTPTLIVGELEKDARELSYQLTGQVEGRQEPVTCTQRLSLPAAEPDNFFLVSLVAQWQNRPGEYALLRADRALMLAHLQARLDHEELLTGAQWALQQNQLEAAARLFEAAREMVPHDGEATAGLKLVEALRQGRVSRETLRKQLEQARQEAWRLGPDGKLRRLSQQEMEQLAQAEGDPKAPPAPGAEKAPGVGGAAGDLLQEHRARVAVEEQKLTQIVDEALNQARRQLSTDPEAAHRRLRDTLLLVETTPDLSDRVRTALIGRLENELRNVAQRGREILAERAERRQITAQARKELDRQALIQAAEDQTEARLRSWRSLLNLARYEELTARQIMEGMLAMQREARIGGTKVPVASQPMYTLAQARFNLQKLQDLKALREQRVLQVFMDVEKTAVPFPDEPPVHFPNLAFWKAITKLRKDKYEVQALPDDPPARAEAMQVYKLLEKEIKLPEDTPKIKLKDLLQLLGDRLSAMNEGKTVGLFVDVNAFKAENEELTPEALMEKEITLPDYPKQMAIGTLLRLALGSLESQNATYVIRRNYIEVTTIKRVVEEKVLRVYPVGELVIPISPLGTMIGMTGFGMAGMGGFSMMGMGGFNMMGMGMMGMGLGMMGMSPFGMGLGMMGMNPFGFGGFNMMGMGMMGMNPFGFGGFNMMGMGMMGMGLGMMGMSPFGMGMMGMMGMGGFSFGGMFPGGFNGNLGFLGASQAMPLISMITTIVAPGEWFKTPAQLAAENFQGGFQGFPFGMGFGFPMGMAGMMGMMPVGMVGINPAMQNFNQGPPLPVSQGGSADLTKANTISFFAPALSLIVRAPTRIHYKLIGGAIGTKGPKMEEARAPQPGGILKVLGEQAAQENQAPGPRWVVEKGKENNALARAQQEAPKLDPKTCWEEPLAKSGGDPGLIIATADFLYEHGQYEHAAEFLKTNLRLGILIQPWVYEALALAMESCPDKYTPAEVERARLSAVALNPHDAGSYLHAAQTLAAHKQWTQAIAYCKEAARLQPAWSQCYWDALTYAEAARDTATAEWAASQLLGQDWPVDNDRWHERAQQKVWSLIGLLTEQGRQAEAERLRTVLQKLRERDLVIRVSWEPGNSGPAEFELEIQEPGGSLCSSQFRQSPGGGTLLGGSLRQINRLSYVAAQAYSGTYQVTLRRLWGQPLGGKVRLEIITHQGTPQEQAELRTLNISQQYSFTLTLTGGRRTAPAVVPPAGASTAEPADEAPTSGLRILRILRQIADADFSDYPGGFSGGVGGPLGARTSQPQLLTAEHQSERLAFQAAVPSAGGIHLTTQATLSPDRRALRLTVRPDFNALPARRTPVLDLPFIPGSTSR
jgi:tetratricopeptide (TPR) repeat protein